MLKPGVNRDTASCGAVRGSAAKAVNCFFWFADHISISPLNVYFPVYGIHM